MQHLPEQCLESLCNIRIKVCPCSMSFISAGHKETCYLNYEAISRKKEVSLGKIRFVNKYWGKASKQDWAKSYKKGTKKCFHYPHFKAKARNSQNTKAPFASFFSHVHNLVRKAGHWSLQPRTKNHSPLSFKLLLNYHWKTFDIKFLDISCLVEPHQATMIVRQQWWLSMLLHVASENTVLCISLWKKRHSLRCKLRLFLFRIA